VIVGEMACVRNRGPYPLSPCQPGEVMVPQATVMVASPRLHVRPGGKSQQRCEEDCNQPNHRNPLLGPAARP
jgi:hypothetical protein